MGTLIYSPGVRVLIDTEQHGIVDVSEDIRDGSVTLAENLLATLNLNLINHRRKYDGVFTPNDRVHVQMKRVTWMPIMSGYLNTVPYFSIYPRTIPLSASCTLKRLKYRYWDSGARASVELLWGASPIDNPAFIQQDGGLRDKVYALLTKVADWPEQNIHIGRIPDEWGEKTRPLREAVQQQIASIDLSYLGTLGVANGTNAASHGSTTKTLQPAEEGPGKGVLPYQSAQVQQIDTIDGVLDLTAPERGGPGAIGSGGFNDEWYLVAKWPYLTQTSLYQERSYLTPQEETDAKKWWKKQRLMVINPANDRAVILRPVHWGPENQYGLGVSPQSLSVLGAKTGDTLDLRFAPDGANLGPFIPNAVPVEPGAQTYQTTPDTVQAATGISLTHGPGQDRKLKGNTAAAERFAKANWDIPKGIGGYRETYIANTNTRSDHWDGLALDIMVSSGEPNPQEIALGNAIAQFFVANPDVFGTKYVIWNDRINSGKGWRNYAQKYWRGGDRHPNTTQGHRDHVHVSFNRVTSTQPGPMGNPFPGYDHPRLSTAVVGGGAVPGAGGSGFGGVFGTSGPFLNAGEWVPTSGNTESDLLTGPLTLLNDQPLLPTIEKLTSASQRNFMSAPNGDFIAWFPDYFGVYGTAGKMIVRDIELANEGFTMAWDDASLVTHQFTAASWSGYAESPVNAGPPGGSVTMENKFQTQGIVSVEFPELLQALFNLEGNDNPRADYFRDAEKILQRFGARPNYRPLPFTIGPEAEFWWALHLFQRSWAQQFSARISLTYMPEIYPGMLLQLEGYGLQVYVTSVTHNFNMTSGFTTSATVMAPSTTDRKGIFALPLAGGVPPAPGPRGNTGGGGARVI